MRRRNPTKPPIKLPFWKPDGKLWYANRTDIEDAIRASGKSENALKRQLGVGYSHLEEALAGKRLDGWAVAHVEHGLRPLSDETERLNPTHSWPPAPTKP